MAAGYSLATLWRTEDGGRTFRDSSTGFTGFAWGWWNNAIAFDGPMLYGITYAAAPARVGNLDRLIGWDGKMTLREIYLNE